MENKDEIKALGVTRHADAPPIAPLSSGETDHLAAVRLQVLVWLGARDLPSKLGLAVMKDLHASLSPATKAYWSTPGYVENLAATATAAERDFRAVMTDRTGVESLVELGARLYRDYWVAEDSPRRETLRLGLHSFLVAALAETMRRDGIEAATPEAAADFFRNINKAMHPKGVKGVSDRSLEFLGIAFSKGWAARQSAVRERRPKPGTDDVTYRIPANYWPWRVLRAFMSLVEGSDLDHFAAHGSNFYLLGEQFLHELEDTDLMIDDLRVMEEAPLPHPCFLWLLPLGFLNVTTPSTTHQVGGLLITSMQEDGRVGVGVDLFSYVPDADYDFEAVTYRYFFNGDGVLEAATEDELSAGVLRLLLKVLVSMAAAPKIVECEVTESKRPPKKNKRGLEFRVPRVIGWKIRYIRTGGPSRKRNLEKGHIGPHWRRRHIKRVPYGPMSVPLHERPRRIAVIERTRVNSEYETPDT